MVQQRLRQRRGLAGGGDQVDVVAGLGSPPGRPATSTASLAGWARRSSFSRSATGRTWDSSSRSAGLRSASLPSDARTFSSTFGPRPLSSRIRSCSAAARSSLEARDAELVVEAARGLRAHPGDHGHLDQRGRELSLQLCGGGDLAVIDQREDLLLERLAHAGQLGGPAGAGKLLDRHGALPDHPSRLAICEDPVPDRPVELVQRRQLGERVGDLGVSHTPKPIPAQAAANPRLNGTYARTTTLAGPQRATAGSRSAYPWRPLERPLRAATIFCIVMARSEGRPRRRCRSSDQENRSDWKASRRDRWQLPV